MSLLGRCSWRILIPLMVFTVGCGGDQSGYEWEQRAQEVLREGLEQQIQGADAVQLCRDLETVSDEELKNQGLDVGLFGISDGPPPELVELGYDINSRDHATRATEISLRVLRDFCRS